MPSSCPHLARLDLLRLQAGAFLGRQTEVSLSLVSLARLHVEAQVSLAQALELLLQLAEVTLELLLPLTLGWLVHNQPREGSWLKHGERQVIKG